MMILTKKGNKWTEESLTRTAKMMEIGFKTYEVNLYEDVIGTIEHSRGIWKAKDIDGKYLGSSSSKKEARFIVAWDFVGDESIDWN